MNIYLLGASNPESIRIIKDFEQVNSDSKILGFIDNDIQKKGKSFYGYPIIGGLDMVAPLVKEGVYFVNLITRDTLTRKQTTDQIISLGGKLTNLIHPSVDLRFVKLGEGNYIQVNVVIQAGSTLGNNSSIHVSSLIGHETKIGDNCFVAHGVNISGCCDIGSGSFVGAGATVYPRIKIGKWCSIGAGSVVNRDIPDFSTAVGNPARIIKVSNENDFK
jgi:sugar O-acyltransferase (sialic acid O-acetyltransferase NeuD family)